MTLTEKRKNKRLAKVYGKLGMYTLLYWVLQLVALIVIRTHSKGDWSGSLILIMIAVVVPVFMSLGFWMVSQGYQGALIIYKNQIKEYRIRKYFNKCMDAIEAGDLNAACEIYSDYIPTRHLTRDYLYSVLITLMSKSDDPDLKQRGTDRIAKLREHFDPAKINF